MSIPDKLRQTLRHRLGILAEKLAWNRLPLSVKSQHYKEWTADPEIGGILMRYMDAGHVRMYIKDTLLKSYARESLASDKARVLSAVGCSPQTEILHAFIKPHGRILCDGRLISWGRAEDWKTVILATFERAYGNVGTRPFAAVLLHASGRFHEEPQRAMIRDAARKLCIEKLVWMDD